MASQRDRRDRKGLDSGLWAAFYVSPTSLFTVQERRSTQDEADYLR